jgi:hypothetical protein
MKNRHLIIGLAVAAIGFSASAPADEIYKWTDAEGNIHYEDRPDPSASVELLRLSYKRTDNEAVSTRIQARLDSQAKKLEDEDAATADAATAAKERAVEVENKKRCDKYHAQIDVMAQARRLYREDEKGERVYLDDSQREEARAKATQLIRENCSS